MKTKLPIFLIAIFVSAISIASSESDQLKKYSETLNLAKEAFLKDFSEKNFEGSLDKFDKQIFGANFIIMEGLMQQKSESAAESYKKKWIKEMEKFFVKSVDVKKEMEKYDDSKYGKMLPLKECFAKKDPMKNCYHLNKIP